MSLFRRDDPSPQSPAVGRPQATPQRRSGNTVIAAGARIVGRVEGTSEVTIEGHVEGAVVIEGEVLVGVGGRVEGDVSARAVKISGSVTGNVRGSERVEITAGGRLDGNVVSPKVVLAEGAFFHGQVEMSGGAGSAPKQLPGVPGEAEESR